MGEAKTTPGVPMALYVQDAHPIREAMGFVRRAEELGFSAVWQADSRLVREATVPMAAFAATTERIGVVGRHRRVDPEPRPAGASLFSTLDDLAPGRILAGLGAWWDPLATKVGIARESPLSVMREVVEAVRACCGDGPVTPDGDYVHLDGSSSTTSTRSGGPRPCRCTGAGMRMMALAGEIADGAVLNYLVSPDYNRRAVAALSAARPGPAARWTTSTGPSWCACSTPIEAALDALRLLVTQYLGQQPRSWPRRACRSPCWTRSARC